MEIGPKCDHRNQVPGPGSQSRAEASKTGLYSFDQVLDLRPEEPQSYRDLALVLAARADANRQLLVKAGVKENARRELERQIRQDYGRALELLHETVVGNWDGR